MDYLNNVRPDLIPADRELHRAAEDHQVPQRRQDDHVQDTYGRHQVDRNDVPAGHLDDILSRADQTHSKLSQKREQDMYDRDYSRMEREMQEQRRRERQTRSYEAEPAYNVVPETRMPQPRAPATTPQKKSKKKAKDPEQKIKEDLLHQAQEREHEQMERERRAQEDREKAIQDQLDEERKAREDQLKREEERRSRRRDARKQKQEEAAKRREETERAEAQAQRQHVKEDAEAHKHEYANSILDKYPSLSLARLLETSAAEGQTISQLALQDDPTFKIDPHFKKEEVPDVPEHSDAHLADLKDSDDKVPIIDKRIHEVPRMVEEQAESSNVSLFSQSSSSSSAMSSSSSSTSDLSSQDWVSDAEGYRAMDEDEVAAYDHLKHQRRRRATLMEEEAILRHEQEKRLRESATSSSFGRESSSERTSWEEHLTRGRRSSYDDLEHLSDEERRVVHAHREHDSDSEGLRRLHRQYEAELAAVQSDDEHYKRHYSKLEEDMKRFAEQAERLKYEAIREADDAHARAVSAERKAAEAEKKAADLELQAREAEERVAKFERKAKEAEERYLQVEDEWATVHAEDKSIEHGIKMAEQFAEERYYHQHERRPHRRHRHRRPHRHHHSHSRSLHSHSRERHHARLYRSFDSEEDRIPFGNPDTSSLIKHDAQRHEDILKNRRGQQGAPDQKESLLQDPYQDAKTKGFRDAPVQPAQEQARAYGADEKMQKERPAYTSDSQDYKFAQTTSDSQQPEQPAAKETQPVGSRKRPATVYPPDYKPPQIDADPVEITQHSQEQQRRTQHNPEGRSRRLYHRDEARYNDYEEDLNQPREEDFQRYHRGGHAMYLQYEPNEVMGSAMIEENEKARALELFKVQSEQELQDEYQHKISEMTADYRQKLRDLDNTYSQKKTELDRERQLLSQSGSGRSQPQRHDPAMDILVNREPLNIFEPDEQTNETDGPVELDFEIMYPVGWELAAKKPKNPAAPQQDTESVDPLSDIKRRERDLLAEKNNREIELQRDYEIRLAEFELDFKQKERELEKEKLDLERRLISERQHEIDLEQAEARQKRQPESQPAPPEEEEEDNVDDVDEDEDEYEDEDEDEEEDDFFNNSSEEPSENGESPEFFDQEPEMDEQGRYQIEWELDLVPKRVPAKPMPVQALPEPEPVPAKKDQRAKKGRKDKKGRQPEPRKNVEPEPPSRHHRHTGERNARDSRRHRNHRNSKKNQEDPYSHRHHRHSAQNGLGATNEMSFGFEYRRGEEQQHAPIVTQRHMHSDEYGDFGVDAHGQMYKYETYELPSPTLPHLPIARVPSRPPHPLGGHYSKKDVLREALPAGYVPHNQDHTTVYPGMTRDMRWEGYGPMFHDITPELIHQPTHLGSHYADYNTHMYAEKAEIERDIFSHPTDAPYQYADDSSEVSEGERLDQYYAMPWDYGVQANEMTMKSFPKIQPVQYNPETLAQQLEKARKLGNLPPSEEEVPLHRSTHRYQKKSFDDVEETGKAPFELVLNEKGDRKGTDTAKKPKSPQKKAKDLEPKVPKSMKTDKPGKPDQKKPTEQAKKIDGKKDSKDSEKPARKKEEPVDMSKKKDPSVKKYSFDARKDPAGIDFEKIAMRRAAKQAEFRRQEIEEESTQALAEGRRQEFEELLKKEDVLAQQKHEDMDKTFWKQEEKYHEEILMKPRFEDFKLQFEGPGTHQQVADKIPAPLALKPVTDQKPEQSSASDFSKIAREREATHESFRERYRDEDHPRDAHGGRFTYAGAHIDEDEEPAHTAFHNRQQHEQRRLEELGVNFDQVFDLSAKMPLTKTAPQEKKEERSGAISKPVLQSVMQQPLQQPVQMPQSKSYIPSQPPQIMMSPYAPSQVARTETEDPLVLDAAKQQKAQTFEDPGRHHFYQGQQHHEHKFSLMDPVHPAQHDTQEQLFDEHFAELPVFDPSKIQAQAQQWQPQQPRQGAQPYMPQQAYAGQAEVPRYTPGYTQPAFAPQMQQPQQPFYSYFPSQQQQQYSMYQPIAPWYEQQAQYQPVQQPAPQWGQPTQVQVPVYPSTPYMPAEIAQSQSYSVPAPGVTPMKSLPFKPRPATTTVDQTPMPTQEKPQVQPAPQQSSFSPDVMVTKTLKPVARKNQVFDQRDFGEEMHHPRHSYEDILHTYSGSDHPVLMTDTGDHGFISHHGDEFVVSDSGFRGVTDEIASEIGTWFGNHSLFLDSKHDLDAARESNKFLQ